MKNKIIYIKLKKGCRYIGEFEKSYENDSRKELYYYDPDDTSLNELELEENIDNYLIAVVHHNNKVEYAYLGKGKYCLKEDRYIIILDIMEKLNDGTAIQNILRFSDLDLEKDFKDQEFVRIENSSFISHQIDFIIYKPYNQVDEIKEKYCQLESENNLSFLAQKNEYCERQYNNTGQANSCRGEFQRDYERIQNSKSFRRMVDKAQVFSASKGDYYRTRMTHTQAVSQIARGIAEELHLNLYLTEAIALGHDIGHTPFGHQGERTLNDILNGKYGLIKNLDANMNLGGFKHNYQSLRIASLIEEEYPEICGLNLSYQTLEGMLKHTKLNNKLFDIYQYTDIENVHDVLHLKNTFCSTLEGQVVAIADEIAQRGHDLDDALSSGAISFYEFEQYITVSKMSTLKEKIDEINKRMTNKKTEHRRFVDKNELRNSQAVSKIISFFMNDVISESIKKIENYDFNRFKADGYRVSEELITFSENVEYINKYLETIITSKVINSSEVSLFDNNANTVVKGLFKAYYDNPRLLHKGTKRRLYIALRKVSNNVVDFEYGNHEVIRKELNNITNMDLESEEENVAKEYRDKRTVLVRIICDYISGMTDTYALKEYNKIVK